LPGDHALDEGFSHANSQLCGDNSQDNGFYFASQLMRADIFMPAFVLDTVNEAMPRALLGVTVSSAPGAP